MTPKRLSDIAYPIASTFGLYECRTCATELRSAFKAAKEHGWVLKLSTNGGREFIVMRDAAFKLPFRAEQDEAITRTGQHFGVLVSNYVFDNVFRSGILYTEWEKQFDCNAHSFLIERIESF